MTHINKDVVYERPVVTMAANQRNTFYHAIRFTALVLLSTTNALHNEPERKVINSEVVNIGTVMMPDATATGKFNTVEETLNSASADSYTEHLHNLIKLRYPSTDSLLELHKKSSESSVIRPIYRPVELTNEPIETNNWGFRSKRQTEGFGTQTGYKASVGYETTRVAGVDGTHLYSVRPKRQSSNVGGFGGRPGFGRKAEAGGRKETLIPKRAELQSNCIGGAQTGFIGQVDYEVGGGAGAGGKELQKVYKKRQSSSFEAQTGFHENASFGRDGGFGAGGKQLQTARYKRQSNDFGEMHTEFGGQASFGVDGGSGSGSGRKKLQTVREKRQSSGFGAQTGFGANAGFGFGAGVGGASSGTSEQTYRSGAGFGAQGGYGASVGFGGGGDTQAAG